MASFLMSLVATGARQGPGHPHRDGDCSQTECCAPGLTPVEEVATLGICSGVPLTGNGWCWGGCCQPTLITKSVSAARAAPGLGRGCARSPAAQGGAGPFCLCGDRDRDPMPAVTCCPAQPLGPCCSYTVPCSPHRRWAVLEPEGFCSAGYLSTLSTTGGSGGLSSPELPRSGWVGSPTPPPYPRTDKTEPSQACLLSPQSHRHWLTP